VRYSTVTTLLIAEFVEKSADGTVRRRLKAAASPVSRLQHLHFLHMTVVIHPVSSPKRLLDDFYTSVIEI